MSNDLAPLTPTADLVAMDNEQLLLCICDCLKLATEHILRAAQALRVLEERNVDLREARERLGAWFNLLRKVACGQIVPEVLVHFAVKPSLIPVVGALPLDDQRRLAGGAKVEVIDFTEEGKPTHRMIDPLDMTRKQIDRVFDREEGIRTVAQQQAELAEERVKARTPLPEKVGNLVIDKERCGVYHKKEFIPADLLRQALKVLGK